MAIFIAVEMMDHVWDMILSGARVVTGFMMEMAPILQNSNNLFSFFSFILVLFASDTFRSKKKDNNSRCLQVNAKDQDYFKKEGYRLRQHLKDARKTGNPDKIGDAEADLFEHNQEYAIIRSYDRDE